MKRRYQIDQQRAVQQFRQLAREENPNIQMIFPMAEVVGLLQEGVGHLLREAGCLVCGPRAALEQLTNVRRSLPSRFWRRSTPCWEN